jgi:MoxR-like ATPase
MAIEPFGLAQIAGPRAHEAQKLQRLRLVPRLVQNPAQDLFGRGHLAGLYRLHGLAEHRGNLTCRWCAHGVLFCSDSKDWRALAPRPVATYAFAHAISNRKRRQMAAPKFQGTDKYVATDDLRIAVNAAVALERPLLVKGEPGTGKTELAFQIADAMKAPLITWHVKSTTKAIQGLYEYDAVTRLRDSQLGDARVKDVKNYIRKGKMWEAFESPVRPILLIDEIDKADIEFPNDLLLELDRMEFFVYETGETIKAAQRPIILITSNNEKELPDAFLRRCFFHYIKFPERETMQKIVDVHYPNIKQKLVAEALNVFYQIRDVPGLKKKPSTSELLDWLKLLLNEDIPPEALKEKDPTKLIPPLHGALLKNEQDVHLFERLAFLARRESRN